MYARADITSSILITQAVMQAAEAMCICWVAVISIAYTASLTAKDTWPKSNKAETLNVPKLHKITGLLLYRP